MPTVIDQPVHITDASFEADVLQSAAPVIVDFWAPWCVHCRVIAPILAKLAQRYAGEIVVAKINTDEDVQYASRLGVRGLPTMVVFQHGQEVDRWIGAMSEAAFEQRVQRLLGR
ncbi:thioredoxin [Herpetosiphon geysericola]|uniref:Thioredoxin n=1 Tax=Herpetosiphon geysericola TaxID=70996 RepID=A0A0P6YXF4_9CHLR|nr:thioredoxin [Herpetosiphon geysericola]KPL88780.1 thioredoxin [Herpetosiphon geysericola]